MPSQVRDHRCASAYVFVARSAQDRAGSTFSIYLFHFPVLVFVYSLTHYDRDSTTAVIAAFAATLAACVALSYGSERRKRVWTSLIVRMFEGVQSHTEVGCAR